MRNEKRNLVLINATGIPGRTIVFIYALYLTLVVGIPVEERVLAGNGDGGARRAVPALSVLHPHGRPRQELLELLAHLV